MGVINRGGALYSATGIDNTGLYKGKREAMGIIKSMAGEITSFDIFGGLSISAATAFAKMAKDAYTFEKDFQKSMYEVASISTEIKGSLTDYMNSIMDMTRQIPVAANDSAKALYQIVSAGHDGADAMNILEVSAKAAIGGVTNTATAADAITTVLNSYKMSASEAGIVSDQLFMTAKLGKTTIGELGQSIAQVVPIAASYGVEIDQVLAAVASLTKQGTPTAQAMTQIRASIVGVSKVLGDGAFEGRTFQEALTTVAEHAGGSESKLRALIPEIEAINGVLGLTGNNAKAAASDLNELGNSLGASEVAFRTMQESADNQLQLLQNNIIATLRPLGEGILKEVSNAAQKMNDAFSNGDMESSLQTLETLIKLVSIAFVAYKANVHGAAIVTTVQATAISLLNNVKSAYNIVSGAGLVTQEKERVAQVAYIASLEKTLNVEQRSKLSKMNLQAGTKEYAAAITELKEKEKIAADKQVATLGKETSSAEKSMVIAKERAASSSVLVEARKQELAALTSTVQAEKMATAQKELAGATDKQRMTRENAIALNRQKIAAQQAVITAKESGQSAAKIAALEREIRSINKKVVASKAEYAAATQAVTAKQAEIASINRGITSKSIETATKRLNTAVEKENTASTAANAAMKDFYSKKSATAIASTQAGTIATSLNSAQQRGNAAAVSFSATAHNFLAAAKMKAVLATKALTVAIAANPIGALLTVASLAASAIMMFGKETGDAATVQERFNKSLEEQKRQLDELKSKTEEYLEVIRSETSTQYDKEKALDSLQKMMPTIFKNMDIEKLKLMDILSLNKQIAEEINRRERIGAQTNLVMATNKYSKASAEYKRKTDMNLTATNALSEKNEAFLEMELAQKQVDKILNIQKKAEESLKPKNLKIISLQSNIDTLKAEIAEMQGLVEKEKRENDGWSPNSWILDAKKGQLSTKEKEMTVLNPPKTKKANTVVPLTDAEKAAAKKKLETSEEIAKTVLAVELKLQQERVFLMSEGRAKVLSEIEADKKARLQAIDEEEKELAKKYTSVGKYMPADVSKDFSQRRNTVEEDSNHKIKSVNKDYDQKEIDFQKELSSVFLTEEEKRKQAIQDRYDTMRKAQQESYEAELRNIELTKTGEKAQDAKTAAVIKYNTAFSGINKAQTFDEAKDNKEKLDSLISQLNDFKSKEYTLNKDWDKRIADAAVTGDADLLERMKAGKQKALSELNAQMLMQSSEWVRLFGNLDTLTVGELNKLVASIQSKIDEGSLNLNPVDLQILMDKLNSAKDKIAQKNPFKALSSSMKETKIAIGDLRKAEADGLTGDALDKYKDKVSQAAERAKKAIAAIADAYEEVRDVMKSAAEMISMVDEGLGETVNNAITMADAVKNIGEVVANAVISFAAGMSTMETASVILLIIKAVIMAVMAAIALFNGDKKHEKKIVALQENVDKLKRAYDRLGEAIEGAFSTNKAALIDKESENLRQQNDVIAKQMQEERDKKKTDYDKIHEWENIIDDNNRKIEENTKKRKVEAIMGTEIMQAIDDFAQAYAAAWAAGEKAAGKSAAVVKNLIKTAIIDMLKKDLKDEVTAFMTFLSEAMADGIIDSVEQKKIDEWEKKLEGIADETLKGKEKWLEDEESKKKDGVTGKLQEALTEGTASELVGLWHMTSLDTRELKEMSATHFEESKAYRLNVESILEETRQIKENTGRTADNTDGLIEELQEGFADLKKELGEIKSNTKNNNSRG